MNGLFGVFETEHTIPRSRELTTILKLNTSERGRKLSDQALKQRCSTLQTDNGHEIKEI